MRSVASDVGLHCLPMLFGDVGMRNMFKGNYYGNTHIQIYRKFHLQKLKNFQIKNSDIFHISAQNIDCGYSLEPPQRQSMFLSRNKKNNVYPCIPQFYCIKVGFKGVKITQVCFPDGNLKEYYALK